MKPDEFAAMTPREFRLLADGAAEREARLQELLAWHAAHVMAPHLKRPVQPFQLLGRPPREAKKKGKEVG